MRLFDRMWLGQMRNVASLSAQPLSSTSYRRALPCETRFRGRISTLGAAQHACGLLLKKRGGLLATSLTLGGRLEDVLGRALDEVRPADRGVPKQTAESDSRCLVLVGVYRASETSRRVYRPFNHHPTLFFKPMQLLCGFPLPLLSAEPLPSLRLWKTPHSPVWVEDVFLDIVSGIKGDSTGSGRPGIGRVFGLSIPNQESRRADSNADLLITSVRSWLPSIAGCCKSR